jgi:photosystem II stability/assembly factor-like uncharacterized protein
MMNPNNHWKQVGAWWGGTVSAVALSPHFETDHLVLAATLAGIYRSTDGGWRWQLSLNGLDDLTTQTVAFAPAGQAAGLTAFAATGQGRLYRSQDGGASWQRLDSWKFGVISAITLSPGYAADRTLFVGTAEGVFRSFDQGQSWQSANFGLLDLNVLTLACAPDFTTTELLWLGTAGGGFYRSRNAGRAWRETGFGLPDSAIQCLAVSPAFVEDQTLFIGSETAGLFRSQDSGQNWEGVGLELAGQSINTLALPPNFHAASLDLGDTKTLLAGTSGGVFLSPDGGESWLRAHNGPTAPLALAAAGGDYVIAANYQEGIAISQDGGRQWQPSIAGLAAHVPPLAALLPGRPDSVNETLVATAIDSGLVYSQDSGATWQNWPLTSNEIEDPAITALAAAENFCVVATAAKLYRLTSGAETWIELSPPLEAEARINLLASDQGPFLLLATEAGTLYLSEDAGDHWQPVPTPALEEAWLLQAAVSVMEPGVASGTSGVEPLGGGSAEASMPSLAVEPTTSVPSLNLVTVKPLDRSGFELQLWQSTDKGSSWQELLSISPVTTPAVAILAASRSKTQFWNEKPQEAAIKSPLFLALQNEIIKLDKAPAGQELDWSRSSLAEGLYITALAQAGQTLFAATNRGIFYSINSGANWQPLGQGLEGRAVVALLIPAQQRMGAVTLGGEVWWLE